MLYTDNDLFNTMWTTGNLSAISPIVTVVGFIVMCIISLGGFFMVLLPLVRNVINGIVVVAPNLCDKIDEAKRTKLGLQQSEGGNQIVALQGSLIVMLLSIPPNFKALSDFEDGIRDPKSFMTKGIAMMCIYIFIGVFIFYGYPAQVASKFSTAATSLIDVTLANVDPEAWVEKIPTNLARPDFSTNGATGTIDKNVYKASSETYKSIVSSYSNITKDNKIKMSRNVEGWVDGLMNQISDKADSKDFKMTAEARVTTYKPELNAKSPWPAAAYDEDEHIYVYQVLEPLSTFNLGVPDKLDNCYVQLNLKFAEQSSNDEDITNVKCIATVPNNTASWSTNTNGHTTDWKIPTGINAPKKGTVKIGGVSGTVNDAGTIVKFSSDPRSVATSKTECSGLYATDTGQGTSHQIVYIVISGSGAVKFTPVDSSTYNSWNAGGSPTYVNAKANAGTATKTN